MKFDFYLEPRKTTCIGEHLTATFNSIFFITTNSEASRARIFDPNGNTVYNKENQKDLKINFHPYETGIHQICIDNFSKTKAKYKFEYLYGVAAKDYSILVKAEKIKPMELNLIKLRDTIQNINQEFTAIMDKEKQYFSTHSDQMSSTMVLFSTIILIVICVVNALEFLYLRVFISKKKLK